MGCTGNGFMGVGNTFAEIMPTRLIYRFGKFQGFYLLSCGRLAVEFSQNLLLPHIGGALQRIAGFEADPCDAAS